MNQKSIKDIKKEIVDESAINVGYYEGTLPLILEVYPSVISEILSEPSFISDGGLTGLSVSEIDNILITEAVKKLSYSEFKKVAHKFFSYELTESEILAQPIEISRKMYQEFTNNYEELSRLKNPIKTIDERIQEATTSLVTNDNEILAYNLITEQLAVLKNDIYLEPFFDDGLISDYQSSKSELALIVDYLSSTLSPEQLTNILRHVGVTELDEVEIDKEFLVAEFMKHTSSEGRLTPALISAINNELTTMTSELIQHTVYGYSQGDRHTLTYALDNLSYPDKTKDNVLDYLEHEIGAYYRGSLVELVVYDRDMEMVDGYCIDRELFWENPVAKVNEILDTKDFVYPDIALSLDELGTPFSLDELKTFSQLSHSEQKDKIESLSNQSKTNEVANDFNPSL